MSGSLLRTELAVPSCPDGKGCTNREAVSHVRRRPPRGTLHRLDREFCVGASMARATRAPAHARLPQGDGLRALFESAPQHYCFQSRCCGRRSAIFCSACSFRGTSVPTSAPRCRTRRLVALATRDWELDLCSDKSAGFRAGWRRGLNDERRLVSRAKAQNFSLGSGFGESGTRLQTYASTITPSNAYRSVVAVGGSAGGGGGGGETAAITSPT
jgi:hypothetical protein